MTGPDCAAPPLAIRLFGPFEVRLKGAPLPRLRSRKVQWLLALLSLRHEAAVERAWLAGVLWPDTPESQAMVSLRSGLTDLRRALGPEADRLRSPSLHTLSLDLSGAQVDLVAFDQAIARAGAAMPDCRAEPGCERFLASLEQAISLYRGPLLEGCAEEWAFQERQAREQAYLGALERLAAPALERGDPAAERYLRRVVAVDPLRESAQRALMQALAAGGSYTAAAQVYQDLRRLLHQELNAEPDPETQALFQQLRAGYLHGGWTRAKADGARGRRGDGATGRRGDSASRADPSPHDVSPSPRLPVSPSLPIGTVTFLLTDIEGSTKLWLDHPEAMRHALARHDDIAAAIIQQYDGLLIKQRGEGDSLFAVFPRATDAVAAALEFQRALSDETGRPGKGEAQPAVDCAASPPPPVSPSPGRPLPSLRVRIALHTGEAELREGDYFGLAVNHCARLRAVGHGGQILLSSTTAALVRDEVPADGSLRELGTHRLKDLQRPEPLFQLLHPELQANNFPPLRSLEAFAHNLPVQLTRFVGREEEMSAVKRLLASTHLLTLSGAGGCGKTRLALQVAADLVEEYRDGVWLVELASLSEAGLVAQTVASTLGMREEPGRPLIETLADSLRPRSLLLVLDNCEHLLPACAQLADRLLRACPNLRILATSREGLSLLGEQAYRVPPLSLPDPRQLPPLERLQAFEAVGLFVDRAVLSQPTFALTSANARAVVEVCQRLEGIPLAIELAAARVKALPVEKIAERLDDRFRLLTGGSRTALPRQQTLRALIDWSYDLLTERERMLLRRLSVFAGGWMLEAAEAVCSEGCRVQGAGCREGLSASTRHPTPDTLHPDDVLDLLMALVEKSLVLYEAGAGGAGGAQWGPVPGRFGGEAGYPRSGCGAGGRSPGEGEARYRLLETVRQYARDRLLEAGEAEAVRTRHRDWFLGLAEQGPGHERLEAEHDNLRAALAWTVAQGEGEAGVRLGSALGQFWTWRGYWTEGREHLAGMLALPGAEARTTARAGALHCAGLLAWQQGEFGAARALHEKGLAINRELGDKGGISGSLNYLGLVVREQGDLGAARALLEESLAIDRELGGKAAWSLMNLGWVACDQGDLEAARALSEESLAIAQERGDKFGVVWSLNTLGNVAHHEGDLGAARALSEESLAIARELGEKRFSAMSLNRLGLVAREQGDLGAARALIKESLAIFRALGHKQGIAQNLEGLAVVAVAQAESERAARLFGAAEGLREAIGAPLPPADRAGHDRAVAAVRTALGEAGEARFGREADSAGGRAPGFAAAWAEGRAMTLEQAVRVALEEDEIPTTGRQGS